MKLFLSWSGDRSRALATALREWIPLILHYTHPWLSDKDISAGERWAAEVGKELSESHFGIICLTKDNLSAPWVLFEAGALSKALTISSVCPYLLDLEFSEVSSPLSQFQAKKTDKKSTYELLEAINTKASDPIDTPRLRRLFDALWPEFEEKLQEIPEIQSGRQPVRRVEDMLEEIVITLRANDRRFRDLELEMSSIRGILTKYPVRVNDQPSARVKSEPKEVRGIILKVKIDIEGTSFPHGALIHIEIIPSSSLIEGIATITGVSLEDYGKDWDLYYPNIQRYLSSDEASHIYRFLQAQRDPDPIIELSEGLPF